MFPGDIMHLILNLADLLMNLWQGKFDCGSTDSRTSWTWAVLQGDIWKTRGQDVANCTPGSFDSEILLRKLTVAIRLGSFSYTFSDLARDFYMVFFHDQSGDHSASLFQAYV